VTNTPKNHHFVAQMHASRFTDADGMLWAYIKKTGKLFRGPPKSVFAETHLYTIEGPDGKKDTSFESALSKLESAANPVIGKLVDAARAGGEIGLTAAERETWDHYVYIQWKRVPDVHAKIATSKEQEDRLDEIFSQARAQGGDIAAQAEALDNPVERKRILQGGKVKALELDPGTVRAALASRGVVVLRITAPGQSFAIGSLPIVRKEGHPLDADAEVWLPVASDVAVGIGGPPGAVTFVSIDDPVAIHAMNRVTAGQSSTFAAASKALVETLRDEVLVHFAGA
jgi:hypothetical protein